VTVANEDLSDEQLMLMFRYGNRAAFELLFEKYRGPVYGFARRMLGNSASAEDACQETFLRMVTSAGTYEPSARFRAWLFTIARNCCLNMLRRPRVLTLLPESPVPDRRTAAPPVAAARAECDGCLEQAIAELPEAWREAFLLRYRHALEYQEIADVTGQPLGTVKTHIHRARLQLAIALQDHLGAKS
jgi:RNA polymerase sigma-70 factor (ECF subfamily)